MLIPEKLTNFKVYGGNGGVDLLGSTDVELPAFTPMVEKIMGAGIAGEYDSPVPGHFQSMTVKLKWRVFTSTALGLLAPIDHGIQLRGAVSIRDTSLGALVTQAVLIQVNGPMKSFGLGNFEVGKPTNAETEIELAKILVKLDGVDVVELDKFNNVFKVGGIDYLADTRLALGIV